jgi:hypothetical protein
MGIGYTHSAGLRDTISKHIRRVTFQNVSKTKSKLKNRVYHEVAVRRSINGPPVLIPLLLKRGGRNGLVQIPVRIPGIHTLQRFPIIPYKSNQTQPTSISNLTTRKPSIRLTWEMRKQLPDNRPILPHLLPEWQLLIFGNNPDYTGVQLRDDARAQRLLHHRS